MDRILPTVRAFPILRVLVLGVSVMCLGCKTLGPSVSARIATGADACAVVSVPVPWALDEHAIWPISRQMIYAWSANGDGFLFSLARGGPGLDHDQPIEQKYLVSLSNPWKIRAASEGDWQARRVIQVGLGDPELGQLDGQRPRGTIYHHDRRLKHYPEFAKSGAIWNWAAIGVSWALPAPGNQFIALESFDGYYAEGKADWSNDFYIDVYEIATRRRLALIRGK